MKTVSIGMVGAGRATELHMCAYKRVFGVNLRYKARFDSIKEKSAAAKEKYNFESSANDIEELLNDPEIDVIDICTPPYTHKDLIIRALKANKHVICEKPLCGFFGSGDTDKKVMYGSVMKDLDEIEALGLHGVKLHVTDGRILLLVIWYTKFTGTCIMM